ncbi:hypothetical protein MIND_00228200 [Mycena indigotica]|uniref:Uncharacterized protein n=1 Tax=Mycena indigotica TaxID=2126181 RepID=A0A8H6T743_9AGAR|nr:uncharacterized protein MIND_00228200 [Mycena indigotica]KAF7312156.1 hypothetical protein MIND_00228200 [Mycena indigotica]
MTSKMSHTQPPSLFLPSLRNLAAISPSDVSRGITYLRSLYTPRIRGSKILGRITPDGSTISWPSSSPEDLDALVGDEFERGYSIRWLTYLAHNATQIQASAEEIAVIIDSAAAVLANCGGPASAGVLIRTIVFPASGIEVTLQDIPLDNGMASVGAQTWGGAFVLAEMIATHPEEFQLHKKSQSTLRVLELGSGTGLVGITVAKIANHLDLPTRVVCTDAYPPALHNLATNISANFDNISGTLSVESLALDWSIMANKPLTALFPPPLDIAFDIILGADIIYEAEHALWIRKVLTRFLRRNGLFHLLVPLRPTHAAESGTIEMVFIADGQGPEILSKETILCAPEKPSEEEIVYAYYRIGWQ